MKTLSLVNNAGAAQTIIMGIGGTTAAFRFYRVQIAADSALMVNDLFIVLQPGETIQATTGAGSIACAGFGAELEGVAD